MASLFLSYSRDDVLKVGRLAAALESSGHRVWWDRHLSGGEVFTEAIERELESADVVIVCWSARSVHSPWVRDEAAVGRDRGRLLPVSFDNCLPPLGFRQYHVMDLSPWNGEAQSDTLDPLKDAVADMASGKKQGGVGRTNKPPASRPRAMKRPLILGLVAALALLAGAALLYPRIWGGEGGIDPKVAVGTLDLASADLPRELPDLIGQEIVAAFGAENAVTVISSTKSSAGARAPFVMDGSVSRFGAAVRFTVNLKDQRSGVVLWSSAFEQETADAVAARQVAVGATQVVRCGLWGASNYKKHMSDETLSLYLKWCNEHWSGSTSPNAELDAARRVTVAVPDFSFGWSALALAAVPLVAAKAADSGKLLEEARLAARKSIVLDEENPEGFMALAGLLPLDRFAERENLLKKALNVRPTECGCERQAYGDFLASVGRVEEAVEQFERARDMRPLAPFSNLRFAQALYMVGRHDEADRVLRSALELWPGATSLRLLKIKSTLWTRRYDDALRELSAGGLPLTSVQRQALADAFAALNNRDDVLRARSVAVLAGFAGNTRTNDKIVVGTLAALGAREPALRAAANLVRARGLLDAEVLFEPNLASARAEPGYAELVREFGLIAYWRSASRTPDICRNDPQPSFCPLQPRKD